MSAILIINSPQKNGSHSCKWYVAFKNEKQQTVKIGEPFTVSFEICDPNAKKEEKNEEPELPAPELKKYSSSIMDKAKKLKDIFPDANVDSICEFVNTQPDEPVEDLVEAYLAAITNFKH